MSTPETKIIAMGKLSVREFSSLALDEKRAYLKTLSAKEQMELIISDPDGKRVTRSLGAQEFFWLFKEIGEEDAVELLPLASTEQCVFMLDMELWEGWNFSQEKAIRWLTYLMEGGKPRVHELLKHLDHEFFQLFLGRELLVGGGIGDLADDEERLADYDHSFDNVFMLTFKNPKHSQLVGSFLSLLIDLDQPLYTALMEGIKSGIDLELEEECLRFRTGRLQDLGFPPFEDAISIYGRVDPDSFQLAGAKELLPAEEGGHLVPFSGSQDSLLFRALSSTRSLTVRQELSYLVNSAIVAEGGGFLEAADLNVVLQRVYGYLNIALEYLCREDDLRAAEVLAEEELKRLFQLGFSLVLRLKFTAEKVESSDYASGKVLTGLKAKRPRFYRGLDAEGVDGYREFKNLSDVQRVADFLALFRG